MRECICECSHECAAASARDGLLTKYDRVPAAFLELKEQLKWGVTGAEGPAARLPSPCQGVGAGLHCHLARKTHPSPLKTTAFPRAQLRLAGGDWASTAAQVDVSQLGMGVRFSGSGLNKTLKQNLLRHCQALSRCSAHASWSVPSGPGSFPLFSARPEQSLSLRDLWHLESWDGSHKGDPPVDLPLRRVHAGRWGIEMRSFQSTGLTHVEGTSEEGIQRPGIAAAASVSYQETDVLFRLLMSPI